ncbi:MAG: DUF423 domain-containing protein [Parafilimonas terrae]|nr:DUF423 domain-containing protein [Parafilimonas terrae]
MRLAAITRACAGLMGAAGVAVSAAATHLSGDDFARTAGLFLLIHAAAMLAVSGPPSGAGPRRGSGAIGAAVLGVGTVLFSGALALLGFWHLRIPLAAPVGGLAMITGWILIAIGGLLSLRGGDR